MDILVYNDQSIIKIAESKVSPIIKSVLESESQVCDEVIIHFVEEKDICALHEKYFNDPSPTDCISLAVDDSETYPRFLGEIFICTQVALNYAKENKIDVYQELTLYLVHGVLHLLGYTDKQEEEIQKMRLAEKRHMDYLISNNMLISA